LDAVASGAPYGLACQAAGICHDTFNSWRRADPTFARLVDSAAAEFESFEAYCRDRWTMSRIHAHRMIEAANVASNLLPIVNIPVRESQVNGYQWELYNMKDDFFEYNELAAKMPENLREPVTLAAGKHVLVFDFKSGFG
jgi:hypothetical protein